MFRIYFDDGLVYDSAVEGELSRRHGVICVVQPDDEIGRAIICEFDWYYRKGGVWFGADTHGLLDQVVHFANQIDQVLQGRMVDRDTYQQIINAALDSPGLPRKSAKRPKHHQGR